MEVFLWKLLKPKRKRSGQALKMEYYGVSFTCVLRIQGGQTKNSAQKMSIGRKLGKLRCSGTVGPISTVPSLLQLPLPPPGKIGGERAC